MSKRCRICLCLKPRRDITELEITEDSTKHSYEEIILFCLDIKVDEDSKLGTKLCVKCHRKILDFYNFKTMAKRNNTVSNNIAETMQTTELFFKEVEMKCEVNDEELPNEEIPYNIKTEDSNDQSKDDVQNEELPDEVQIEYSDQSDAEVSPCENMKEERGDLLGNTKNDLKKSMVVIPSQKLNQPKIYKSSGYCKKCGKIVNRLQEHMVMHLPEDIWQKQKKGAGLAGTCKVCGKTVKRLKKHMVLHLPEFQRDKEKSTDPLVKEKKKVPVKCLMCGREFVAQQYLDLHMKNLHLRPKKQCPVCGKKVNKLKMHMLTAHNRDQLKFECDWCGMKHSTRYILEKHIAIHTNDRPYHCNDCDKKFIQRSALVIHQRQVHLNLRPFLCQFCSKTYCTNEALKVHVRGAHTKERPFKCSDCDKGFNTKNMLKSHMDHVHTDVKNYACTHCPKKYKTQVEVTRHYKEAHLKIKDYQCRFCESQFYRSTHLKRHEYTIHLRYSQDKTDN